MNHAPGASGFSAGGGSMIVMIDPVVQVHRRTDMVLVSSLRI